MVEVKQIVPTGHDIAGVVTVSAVLALGLRATGMEGVEVNADSDKLIETLRGKAYDFVIVRCEHWVSDENAELALQMARNCIQTKNGHAFLIRGKV